MASKVQRNAVPVPNEQSKGNRVNSSAPLGKHAAATKAPNAEISRMECGNSFMSMAKKANDGTFKGSNDGNKFNVDNARIGYDDNDGAAVAPGKGAIPVNPFTDSGKPAIMNVPLRDTAKRGK